MIRGKLGLEVLLLRVYTVYSRDWNLTLAAIPSISEHGFFPLFDLFFGNEAFQIGKMSLETGEQDRSLYWLQFSLSISDKLLFP